MIQSKRIRASGAILLVFVAGLVIGLIAGRKWPTSGAKSAPAIRLSGYRFINPLLECEVAGEQVEFRELRPFKQQIIKIIDSSLKNKTYEHVSVYFRDLNNGMWFGIDEKELFAPASLLKVPTMIAILKEAEQRPGFLSTTLRYDGTEDLNKTETFKPLFQLEAGKSYTIEELLYRSVAQSDNNANKLLFDIMNKNILSGTYRDLGLAFPTEKTPEDFMSVKQYASFFRILFNASYLSKQMSEMALSLLSQSSFRQGLPAGLPPDVLIAHKFGERISAKNPGIKQLHDCGIIYYPDNPYLLCIMTHAKDFSTMITIITDISAAVYAEVDGQSRGLSAVRKTVSD